MNDQEPLDADFEGLLEYISRSHGFDFRGYKPRSLRRRIEKRMQDAGIGDFCAYLSLLEAEPGEYPRLLDSILINVTSFFRDPAAWKVLEETVLPQLIAEKDRSEPIRLWSAGCASGEEAYSMVMVLLNLLGPEEYLRRVKVYATDVDDNALAFARNAVYEAEAVNAVPEEMRQTYFEPTNGRFAFRRDLRKTIIFGRHNLLIDAPISKIDLIACRNLLIYLDVETQARVLPRLHYALNENGILLLGKAETQLGHSQLFEPIEVRSRIFRRRANGAPRGYFANNGGAELRGAGRSPPLSPRILDGVLNASSLAQIAVSADGVLIFANAAAQRLLGLAAADIGQAFQDLQVSYRPIELRSRIEEAVASRRTLSVDDVLFTRSSTEAFRLSIRITPLAAENGRHMATAVSFHDETRLYDSQHQLATVNNMLDTTVEELQSANEELETTNEEIQSTNEELETTNEELQSANEELETINEELRSTNDELETTNEELRLRTEQLDAYRVHTELVLGSIRTGVVVLDRELKIVLWNRWNENMWGLRAEETRNQALSELDIGLPVDRLRQPIRSALRGEAPSPVRLDAIDRRGRAVVCEATVSSLGGGAEAAGGLVLVLEDVSERARPEEAPSYTGRVVALSGAAILVFDRAGVHVRDANPGAAELTGYAREELQKMALPELLPEISQAQLKRLLGPLRNGANGEVVLETTVARKDESVVPTQLRVRYVDHENPGAYVALLAPLTERDVDAAKKIRELVERARG